jgi:hypothetical protein
MPYALYFFVLFRFFKPVYITPYPAGIFTNITQSDM